MARRLAPEATLASPLGRAPLAGTGTAAATPHPPGTSQASLSRPVAASTAGGHWQLLRCQVHLGRGSSRACSPRVCWRCAWARRSCR